MGTVEPQVATADAQPQHSQTTDGFQLVIDALKLNGIDTIYGLPGIPITDLTRRAQAAGLRVLSFRHEQNAGYAASIAGFLTQKPGICLTVSAPGFLNGLNALAHATVNCFPMILISGSSEREIVDLQQGDYEEMDQLAIAKPVAKAAFRVLHAEDIGVGIARAIRAAVSGRPGGVYLDLPAKLFAQTHRCRGRQEFADQGGRSGAEADSRRPRRSSARSICSRARRSRSSSSARAPPTRRRMPTSSAWSRRPASRTCRCRWRRACCPTRTSSARPPRAPSCCPAADVVMLIGARLNWLLSHGKGKTWGGKGHKDWGGQKFIQVDISPQEADSNVRIDAPVVGDIGSCVSALLDGNRIGLGEAAGGVAERDQREEDRQRRQDGRDAGEEPLADELPQRAERGARHRQGEPGRDARQRGRQRARLHAQHRRHVQAEEAHRRRHLGHHGRRHGLLRRRRRGHQAAGDRDRGRQRLRLLRHGSRDHLPLQPAGVHRDHEQQRRLQGHRRRPDAAATWRRPCSSRTRATTS